MTRLSRFEQELSGQLGDFWKNHAEKELEEVREELAAGKITIDDNGVARNCANRVLMSDMREKVAHVTDRINLEATKEAYEEEVAKFAEEYRKNYKGPSEEELAEMRAAFGCGERIVNILTGDVIQL